MSLFTEEGFDSPQQIDYRQLAADYSLSFRHSQGQLATQESIFMFMRMEAYPAINTNSAGFKEVQDDIQHIKPPKKHKVFAHSDSFALGIVANDAYSKFVSLLESPLDVVPYLGLNKNSILVPLLGQMVNSDYKYVRDGRPDGSNVSFFRRYTIEGKSTGSPTIDRMYSELAELFFRIHNLDSTDEAAYHFAEELGLNKRDSVKEAKQWVDGLVETWEFKNPNQKFIPETQQQAA